MWNRSRRRKKYQPKKTSSKQRIAGSDYTTLQNYTTAAVASIQQIDVSMRNTSRKVCNSAEQQVTKSTQSTWLRLEGTLKFFLTHRSFMKLLIENSDRKSLKDAQQKYQNYSPPNGKSTMIAWHERWSTVAYKIFGLQIATISITSNCRRSSVISQHDILDSNEYGVDDGACHNSNASIWHKI